jgi:hypothetical protein
MRPISWSCGQDSELLFQRSFAQNTFLEKLKADGNNDPLRDHSVFLCGLDDSFYEDFLHIILF